MQHPDRKTKLSKDVFAAGALNGVEWVINTDGSFSLVFKGQTNADGTPVDEKIGGSSITIGKDGTISLKDNNKESLIIDQNNKIVSVNAEKDINFNADNNINISAKASGNITIKDLMLKASGAANIESTGEMSVKSSGNLGVKSSSMKLESDSTINIKGTDITLDAQSINIGVGGSPAVTLQTKFIGLGNMGIPVISIACGPFSSSVKIGN